MVEVPGLRDLEQRMNEALKKSDEQFAQFKENKYLCSQVNTCVHRTYSMFVMILEKSPNFEDRGGECSPPLILYMEKEKAKEDVLGEGLPIYDGIYFCRYLFFVVII